MTLYDLLRKLINGERIWDDEKADALNLIDKMEALNAFGSTALYVGEHECIAGPETKIYETPNWIRDRYQPSYQTPSRTVIQCTICGKEL